ncbi:hypothetical protein I350_04475 [Cryptococcus amylolentus CBS 6273]|uniref:Uncharacterized protein n=1 Tax=Cryptococcus amylolentus CBS 6273 TaxID=1296118 RepID=A0A1E3K233_9TREE|nr:hypothetical protein I350_04475 [Cryptococcus amylolentus CBS 6273]
MPPKSSSRPSGQDSPGASLTTPFKTSSRPSATDPKPSYRSVGLSQDAAQAQLAVSSPLFDHDNIQSLSAPDMTAIVQSSTEIEHRVETNIYNPITRHNDPERRVYRSLEEVLDHNQSMLGIARFASRRQGCPTRPVCCVVGESEEKCYRTGLEDSGKLEAKNDLLHEVTSKLGLSEHITLLHE